MGREKGSNCYWVQGLFWGGDKNVVELVVILAQPCDNLVTIQWFLELENKCGREKTIRGKKVSKKALGNAPGEKKKLRNTAVREEVVIPQARQKMRRCCFMLSVQV